MARLSWIETAVTAEPVGTIFNIQRCSVHDGPGIRTTVFLKGCPLACAWCHNPEGIDPEPQLMLASDRCVACGECVAVCPDHLLDGPCPPAPVPTEGCRSCGACVESCPADARSLVGSERQPRELVAELLRDRPFFDASGGGVTFSGGEPLMQAEFLVACLEACRREGLHVSVDTCGLAPREVVRETARLADLVLFDIKHMDPDRHRHLTGRDNLQILDNLRDLSCGTAEIWIRVPVIPGVNDGADNLEALGTFLCGLPRRHPVFLLPYHDMARGKARRLVGQGQGERFDTPAPSMLAAARDRLMAAGLDATTGGGSP